MDNSHRKPSLWALILLISFPSVATVLISPALPVISKALSISANRTQWLIFIFILGYALGQIIYAPIANRFGRKHAIYTGILIYFIGLALCFFGIFQHLFAFLLWGRFVMALGSAVGMVITFTLINDSYASTKARSIIGYTVLAYAFMPALGIFIGGWLTHLFSWIACFDFYIGWGLLVLLASLTLPESLKVDNKKPINISHMASSYKRAFKCAPLVLFSSIYGLMASFMYIINSAAPFIGIDKIGLTAAHYGSLLLIPYTGQLLGAFFAGKMSHRFNEFNMINIGYSSTILGSLIIFICFYCHWVAVIPFIGPMIFIMFGLPITYSAVAVLATKDYQDKATASAVMSFITMIICFIASSLLVFIPNQSALTMPILFLIVVVIAILTYFFAKRSVASE